MVVAAQPEATEAGADILKAGGNAVDAAMACALVQGVVDPLMCGIAGFGSCGIAMRARAFTATSTSMPPLRSALARRCGPSWSNPRRATAMVSSCAGGVNDIGYQSICVPASLRAYRDAHREHGRLPWEQIVEPAIGWAEGGWTVRPHVAYWWAEEGQMGRASGAERLAFTPASRALYCRPDGTPKRVGDRVVNRDLGQILRLIAKHGDDVFYEGEIAHAIVEDMRRHGGLIASADLRGWKTVRNAPLWGSYRGYRVASNRPPGGGVMLIEMLNILERFALGDLEHNSAEYIRIVAEAMKRATIDKDRHVGDPRFVDVPVERLTGPEHAAALAEEIRAERKAEVPRFNAGGFPHRDTTHVSVIDA
jgi:gamma-glutamyltranspeptidase/glutathione hydrolase